MSEKDNQKQNQIPNIPDSVLDFFNSVYDDAFKETIADSKKNKIDKDYQPADHLSLFQHMETVFQRRESELSEEYSVLKTSFLLGIQDSVKTRKFTMGMTNLMEDMTVFFMYAVIWINCLDPEDPIRQKNGIEKPIDMKAASRRKGCESDLTKCLSKAWEYQQQDNIEFVQPPVIRDRFGLRIIFADNDPQLMLKVTKIIVQILVNPESEYTKNFKNWINTCNQKFGGMPIPKDKILYILSFSFFAGNIKDYINNPKDNSTYQAWHCTLNISGTSPILGGFMFELQSQTWDMHCNNENEDGPASHYQHKLRTTYGAIKAFRLESYPKGMVFFNDPSNPELDMDGITVHANILSRHVSPHVI